jgi:hypothetical protein
MPPEAPPCLLSSKKAAIVFNECSDSDGEIVGTLAIRNLNNPLNSCLGLRAIASNRSTEEVVRQILRAAF